MNKDEETQKYQPLRVVNPIKVSVSNSRKSNTCETYNGQKEENSLLSLAIDEYNDLFPEIMTLTQKEFLSDLEKYIHIALGNQINYPPEAIAKIIKQISRDLYLPNYKRINELIQSINDIKKLEVFKSKNFIPHCNKTGDAKHPCGGRLFQITKKELLCINCKRIYHTNCVLLYCSYCKTDYYTSISIEKTPKQYQPATWVKYHCNAQVNDLMKCPRCQSFLYLNSYNYKLMCFKCKYEVEQSEVKWQCILCSKFFYSEAKIYNPLEFKTIKIAVKQAIFKGIEAKPSFIPCGCISADETIKYKFFHKKDCNGLLYEGKLNGKKAIVCSLCFKINSYDNYYWICPSCKQPFKNDDVSIYHKYIKQSGTKAKRENLVSCSKININDYERICRRDLSGGILRGNISTRRRRGVPQLSSSSIEISNRLEHSLDGKIDFNYISNKISSQGSTQNQNNKILEALHGGININLNVNLNINNINNIKNNKITFDNTSRKSIPSEGLYDEKFNSEDYQIVNKIGEGTFGTIYEVVDSNKNKFALKKILTNSKNEINALKTEYEMLISLPTSQLNLVKIYGMETKQLDKTTYVMYVLMELALRDWEKEIQLRKSKNKYYTEKELKKIIKELVFTLAQLQRYNISHRDIKPQNILLFNDNSVRISDFGEAKECIRDKECKDTVKQTIRGTELYMSPILFKALKEKGRHKQKYTKHNTYKSDVFSFGLCLVLAATLTFKSLCDLRELTDMLSVKIILNRYLKLRYSSNFISFLCNMLEINEKKRSDFIELEKYASKL